jgi:PilZ domain-containing protein
MKRNHSLFRGPTHTEERLPTKQPCTLHFPDHDRQANTANISYGGVGVELTPDGPNIEFDALQSVTVPDLGTFDVRVAWKKPNRIGLAFKFRNSTKADIRACFLKLRNRPR